MPSTKPKKLCKNCEFLKVKPTSDRYEVYERLYYNDFYCTVNGRKKYLGEDLDDSFYGVHINIKTHECVTGGYKPRVPFKRRETGIRVYNVIAAALLRKYPKSTVEKTSEKVGELPEKFKNHLHISKCEDRLVCDELVGYINDMIVFKDIDRSASDILFKTNDYSVNENGILKLDEFLGRAHKIEKDFVEKLFKEVGLEKIFK